MKKYYVKQITNHQTQEVFYIIGKRRRFLFWEFDGDLIYTHPDCGVWSYTYEYLDLREAIRVCNVLNDGKLITEKKIY